MFVKDQQPVHTIARLRLYASAYCVMQTYPQANAYEPRVTSVDDVNELYGNPLFHARRIVIVCFKLLLEAKKSSIQILKLLVIHPQDGWYNLE